MSNAIGSSRESNPSRRICHLRAVPLGHVADKPVPFQFNLLVPFLVCTMCSLQVYYELYLGMSQRNSAHKMWSCNRHESQNGEHNNVKTCRYTCSHVASPKQLKHIEIVAKEISIYIFLRQLMTSSIFTYLTRSPGKTERQHHRTMAYHEPIVSKKYRF